MKHNKFSKFEFSSSKDESWWNWRFREECHRWDTSWLHRYIHSFIHSIFFIHTLCDNRNRIEFHVRFNGRSHINMCILPLSLHTHKLMFLNHISMLLSAAWQSSLVFFLKKTETKRRLPYELIFYVKWIELLQKKNINLK